MGTGSRLKRSIASAMAAIGIATVLVSARQLHSAPPRFVTHRAAATPAHRPAAPLAPCTDDAYTFDGSRWGSTMRWSFHATSVPKGMTRKAAEAAVKRGAANIVTGDNDCGLADRISATQRYVGRTHAGPNIRDDGTCGTRDGRSVVGFGKLPAAEIGLTCWWTRGGTSVESDTKLNKAVYEWMARLQPGCVDSWSVEAVATHEMGHAFGLDHVTESAHGNLTMSPLILPCQNSEATLGLGDVRGLQAQY